MSRPWDRASGGSPLPPVGPRAPMPSSDSGKTRCFPHFLRDFKTVPGCSISEFAAMTAMTQCCQSGRVLDPSLKQPLIMFLVSFEFDATLHFHS